MTSLLLALMLAAGSADEASRRFDAAAARYNRGDLNGALAEFQRVQELAPRPAVLFNIGLIQAALGRAADAHQSLEAVLRAPGSLSAERLALARRRLDELSNRVGQLRVRASPEGATVEVDGRPLSCAPCVLDAGAHWLHVSAAKHAPKRLEVLVAPGAEVSTEVALEPEKPEVSAQLWVTSSVAGARVLIDAVAVAQTPLTSTLAVPPGAHVVQVLRDGYVPEQAELQLAAGSVGQLAFELKEDEGRALSNDLVVEVRCAQTGVQLTVDGARRGVDALSVSLPPGPHQLVFERGGHYPLRREVSGASGERLQVTVELEPTPELRASVEATYQRHRLASVVLFGAGAVGLLGGAGYLFYNFTTIDSLQATIDAKRGALECATPAGRPECERLEGERDFLYSVRWLGFAALGAGALAAAVGAVLLFTAPTLGSSAVADPALVPSFGLSLTPDAAGLWVSARF